LYLVGILFLHASISIIGLLLTLNKDIHKKMVIGIN